LKINAVYTVDRIIPGDALFLYRIYETKLKLKEAVKLTKIYVFRKSIKKPIRNT